MSWISLLFLLPLVYGLVTENDCGEKRTLQDNCRGEDFPRSPPTDAEEFRHACRTVIPAFSCMKNIADVCEPNDQKTKHLAKFISGLKYVCNESTFINQIIGENALCYLTTIDDTSATCRDMGILMVDIAGIEDVEENHQLATCVTMLSQYMCSLGHIEERCGEQAQEAFAEAILAFGMPEIFCPEGKAEQIYHQLEQTAKSDSFKNHLRKITENIVEL